MAKYTYAEIKASLTKKKNSRSSLWIQLWVRKASFPVTYLFINAGWSANMVSILSWIVVLVGAALLCINNFWTMLAGVILTNVWLILDCVDGNIARVKKKKTYMGDFFDAIAGYSPFSFTTIALGVAAYNTSYLVASDYTWVLVLIGGIGSTANVYMRLIHQKYLNCYFVAEKETGQLDSITLKDTEDKRSFAYIREQIDKNLGVSGFFMPWLFIALFTKTFDVMVVCYAFYYVVSFIAISVLYSRRASKFEREIQERIKNQLEH